MNKEQLFDIKSASCVICFDSYILPVPHVGPVWPGLQAQVKVFTPSLQIPPFSQGSGEQSLISMQIEFQRQSMG